ncbi:hypothetical protein C8J56DRAFT_1067458 [Mycena floridula]|nr:hypothetical protein C8J56DRAFT_1067458 [Mycena floridula]
MSVSQSSASPSVMALGSILNQPSPHRNKHHKHYALSVLFLSIRIIAHFHHRHTEQRRAASRAYYHTKRKYVLQERRRIIRDEKARRQLAESTPVVNTTHYPAHVATATADIPASPAHVATSPLPPSSPPPISDEEEEEIVADDNIMLQDTDTLEETMCSWESHWGGRRLWTMVAREALGQSKDPKVLEEDELRAQLLAEYRLHVADGKDLRRRIWKLTRRMETSLTPSQQRVLRVLVWTSYTAGDGMGRLGTIDLE